ncbi:type II toxin-antitoxin system VapC family toxin [Lentzea flava]|uniref:Ribonuclease VapC n=1 Tax=Lentzea flava TaxID=103732 RepID=A0ABQ2UJG3_9PSEU|nr:type II toxin-antitoxin system VapC family toxin [Lentzea flava]MCP2199819.1 putative nucleic acid-binding protein, contains PIN domain [Lentzea flava]GGU40579.1 ribonuclease VapC [Lentzea flava]
MSFTAVVDTSALMEFLVGADPDRGLVKRLLTSTAAAPQLLTAESLHVLRKLAQRGLITDAQAEEALDNLLDAPITLIDHPPLVRRAWELRHAASAYDALYLALAEQLDVPLVTCDARLAGASGHEAEVEVYPLS